MFNDDISVLFIFAYFLHEIVLTSKKNFVIIHAVGFLSGIFSPDRDDF